MSEPGDRKPNRDRWLHIRMRQKELRALDRLADLLGEGLRMSRSALARAAILVGARAIEDNPGVLFEAEAPDELAVDGKEEEKDK